MSEKVFKLTLVVDEGWADAVYRMFSFTESGEIAIVKDKVEGVASDFLTAEEIADLQDADRDE